MSARNTFEDITRAVNNSPDATDLQRRSFVPTANHHLGHDPSHYRQPVPSPNFMMPTHSSRVQEQGSSYSKSHPIISTSLRNAGSKRKASSLIASASKMLKPNISRALPNDKLRSQSASPSALVVTKNRTVPSQIPIKRQPRASPALQSLPPQPSPPPADKPLPSLPIATITMKSPIQRRSLIDATERPLRRSLSPQTGEDEEWPALSPERPALQDGGQYQQCEPRLRSVKPLQPSVSESVILGMAQLKIYDPPTQIQTGGSDKENVATNTSKSMDAEKVSDVVTPTVSDFPSPPISSPAQQPTGYRKVNQKSTPVVRQTKTSAMRMRLSTRSMNEVVQSVANAEQRKPTAPIRSKSRLRHMATGRGSPYTVSSRAVHRSSEDLRPAKSPDTTASTSVAPGSGSTDSTASLRTPAVVTIRVPKSSDGGERKTSVLLPSRLIRHFPNEESEAEISNVKCRRGSSLSVEGQNDPSDADIDTDDVPRSASSTKTAPTAYRRLMPDTNTLLKQPSSSSLSFSELMATPAQTDHELNPDNASNPGSVHGHDEHGGFKIKKLRGRASIGATLRISDSAQKLLAPTDDEASNSQVLVEKRNSSGMKGQLRKSSDLIKSQLQLTRSITERSLARLSSTATTNVRDIDNNSDTDQEAVNDSSVPTKETSSQKDQEQDKLVSEDDDGAKGFRSEQAALTHTPSSIGQGDWPLKDSKSLASASKEHSARESIDSSCITPADWETRKSLDLDLSSPSVQAPQDKAVTAGATRNHFSSPMPPFRRPPEPPNQKDSPPPTPEKDSIFKRKFPPRTSSKQKIPQVAQDGHDRHLSPVHEASEQNLASHLQRQQYGPIPGRFAQPVNVRSFTHHMQDITDGFHTMKKPPQPSTTSKSTGKQTMSNLRKLLHKKSGNIKGSLRIKRTRPAADTTQLSSPPPATPTPLPTEVQTHDFASLQDPLPAATQTALRLLDMARDERPGARQDKFVELGKATIQVINSARDAEKAFEQAKAAMMRAEIYAMASKQAVADVTAMVKELLD